MNTLSAEDKTFISYIFESGTDTLYGVTALESIFKGKELLRNKYPITVFLGDVAPKIKNIDILQYVIFNELCSVNLDYQFMDYPFFVCFYNIEISIAKELDKRLNRECSIYKGMTEIDVETNDKNRNYWRELINGVELFQNIMYGDEEYMICNVGKKYEYIIQTPDKMTDEIIKDNKIRNERLRIDLHTFKPPLIRDIIITCLSLNNEIRIAMSLIWESIEELDSIYILDILKNISDHNIEKAYLCLYYSSQGIERLQKSLISFIIRKQNFDSRNEKYLNELLYSHNHEKLNKYICDYYKIKEASPNSNKLVSTLNMFYNDGRYLNYKIKNPKEFNQIAEYFLHYNEKDDNELIKKKYAAALGKYAKFLYSKLQEITSDITLTPTELETNSKGFLLLRDDKNILEIYRKIKQSKRELLYWLIKKGNKEYININMLKKYDPLDLDRYLVPWYIDEIIENDDLSLIDTVDELYDALCEDNKKEFESRINLINFYLSKQNIK